MRRYVSRTQIVDWRQASGVSGTGPTGTSKRQHFRIVSRGTRARVFAVYGAASVVTLAAADCSQANTCTTGAVGIDAPVVNLVAANCAQANGCSTGAITLSGGGGPINLSAANCAQYNASSVGAIYVGGTAPVALPGYTAVAYPRRAAKPWPFDDKDPDEVIWICFDFRLIASAVTPVSVNVQRFSGADDPTPDAIKQGSPVAFGPKVYQRIAAGVDACTYHFECLVDSADGSRFSLGALLPVRSA